MGVINKEFHKDYQFTYTIKCTTFVMSTSSVCFKILVFYLTTQFTLFLCFSSKINVYGRPTTLFNSNNTKHP